MFTPDTVSTLYVSKKYGNDKSNFGYSSESTFLGEGPLASIEKALLCVAELRDGGHNQPITICLMDELYELSNPIVLKPKMHSVTIKPMSETIISGGFKIKGFKEDVFNGKKCFSAHVPEIESEGLWFTDLYVDGERAQFTKYPKDGTLDPEYVENNKTGLYESSSWFVARKEDVKTISGFKNFGDCFISYNHYWIDEHTPIKSYDLETGKIEFEYPSRFSLSSKHPRSALHYIIENVAECFENPNEWYLDRETSTVYYIPRNDDMTPEGICAIAPLTDKLLILEGNKNFKLENVHLENLEFAYTKGDYQSRWIENGEEKFYASDEQSVNRAHGSVELFHTRNCYIENCTFHSLGVHALTVNNGCTGTKINSNYIYDIGAGGIKIGGEGYVRDESGNNTLDPLNQNSQNTIKNNRIDRCGRRYFAGCGILVKHSFDNYIAHNEISNLYYTGISVGWVWGYGDSVTRDNLIEKNLIYNLGSGVLSDMGGIYTLGKQPGTVIRGNIVHDVSCFDYGAWGIYPDEGTSCVIIENNLCYNIGKNAFHQHYGRMNTVRNNIFVKAANSPVAITANFINNYAIFERNIIVSEGQSIYKTMYNDAESAPNQIVSYNNLIFDTKGKASAIGKDVKVSLDEFQTLYGKEKYSIEADPLFVDYENNDFRLKPDSPAYDIGFEDIDFSDVGIMKGKNNE